MRSVDAKMTVQTVRQESLLFSKVWWMACALKIGIMFDKKVLFAPLISPGDRQE